MKFYFREQELAELATLREQSKETARMAVLTGNRRIGKTLLAEEFAKNHNSIYLFCAKKSEPLLVQEHLEEISSKFELPLVGDITKFRHIFALLIELSRNNPLTVIIDEFQEFFTINPSVYSDIQNLWDKNKQSAKDLSLITFLGFWITQLSAIFYGYFNHDLILMWGYVLAAGSCGLVTLQAIYYRLQEAIT